jgi:hypothetical protein
VSDGEAEPLKHLTLRYAAQCGICGLELAANTPAIYNTDARMVMCEICPDPQVEPSRSAARAIEPSHGQANPGVAGASAQREHNRRSRKREERVRRTHPLLGGMILALSDEPQSTKAWATGARGEVILGRVLDALISPGIRVLHDRRIPGSRANIDHLLVCATGVYVIDAKKYEGRPSLRVDGGILRPRSETLMVGSRDETKLVHGIRTQMRRVEDHLLSTGARDVLVHGMLCFVEADWPVLGGDFVVDGVHVLWPKKAAKVATQNGPISENEIERLHRLLAERFPPA